MGQIYGVAVEIIDCSGIKLFKNEGIENAVILLSKKYLKKFLKNIPNFNSSLLGKIKQKNIIFVRLKLNTYPKLFFCQF